MNKSIYKDINKCKLKNEYRLSTLKGVNNLSRSDLDTIELYAKTIENQGSYSGLMEPGGNVKKVLEKYNFVNEKIDKLSGNFYY
jgi:hypothetical protein